MASGKQESGKLSSDFEKSEVGSPLAEAQQALKDKYETVKESMEKERSAQEEQGRGDLASSTGLDDAKTMLRDEYEDAKKSMSRHEGAPRAADASELVHGGDELESGAERMLDDGAPDASLKTQKAAMGRSA